MNKKTRLTLAAAAIATFSGAVLAAPETFIIDGSRSPYSPCFRSFFCRASFR